MTRALGRRRGTPSVPADDAAHDGSWREWVVLGALAALAVVGLLSPGQFNLLPAESLLEVVFFLVSASLVHRTSPTGQVLLVVAGGYVLLKLLLLLFFGDAGLLDFLLAYKSFVYVALLGTWVGAGVFTGRHLARFTSFLVAVFLLKYGYSVVLGLADRPGVYLENNFELIMLLGVFLVAHPHLTRGRAWVFVGIVATVLLSGSRSAALGLMVVYLFLYLRTTTRTWPLQVIGTAVVGYAVLLVFSARAQSDGGARLDRLNFLDTFLYEVRGWPIWEWVTGSFPLTPLSPGSCESLSFYAPLFSKTDPGVCYSVILHSYFLRAVFDHGLLGTALLLVLLWVGLRRAGADRRQALALLALISVSGLSVSAFNNVFSALTLAIAMALVRQGAEPGTRPLRAGSRRPGAP